MNAALRYAVMNSSMEVVTPDERSFFGTLCPPIVANRSRLTVTPNTPSVAAGGSTKVAAAAADPPTANVFRKAYAPPIHTDVNA